MVDHRGKTILASTVAILIALTTGLGIYYIQHAGSGISITTIKMPNGNGTDQYPLISNATNTSLGLQLQLTIGSAVYHPGDNVSVNITEYNILGTQNNVTAANNWPNETSPITVCDPIYPLRVGIVRGFYVSNNISQISSTQIVHFIDPNVVYPCQFIPVISSYNFQPQSDNASALCSSTVSNCYYPMTSSIVFNGSWIEQNNSGTNTSATLENLSPGVYTVAGGDEWGDLTLLHFVVNASTNSEILSTSSEATSTNSQTTSFTTTSYPGCGSLGCTSAATFCSVSAEPTGFYLHVIADGTSNPVQGARLNATLVNGCGNPPASPDYQIIATNSTGWAKISIPQDASGAYSFIFTVQYHLSNFSKTFQVGWAPQQGTFVTLSLPSGIVSINYRFPISCNGVCYYLNIPESISVVQPTIDYIVQLWTNNSVSEPTISNITLLTQPANRTQVIQFYLPVASYVFVSPTFTLVPNSNGTLFYLTSINGTTISTTVDTTDNLLYTNERVQGWIEINSFIA